MKRRTWWILGLSIGIPVVLIGGLLLVVMLTSPPTEISATDVREVPDAWHDAPSALPVPAAAESDQPEAAEPTLASLELPIRGTLALEGDGRSFGEETYELSLEGDAVVLQAEGRFWFKALIATINLSFEQTMHWNQELLPLDYEAAFNAPLGFSRHYQATFGDQTARIQQGDRIESFPFARERSFIQGTFSTYAIVPLLDALRSLAAGSTYDVLMFGGPPGQGTDGESGRLSQMSVRRVEDGVIRAGDEDVVVSRYEVSSSPGSMFLFARGIEFLGLYAGDEEDSLFVYRADYFPDGFEIVEPSAVEPGL